MDQQIIHPDLQPWLDQVHGGRLDQLLAFVRQREPFATTKDSTLWLLTPQGQATDPPQAIIIKCCDHRSLFWRFLLGRAWEWREFHNLQALDALGIPVARPLACGQQRDRLKRMRCSVIVTGHLADTHSLVQLLRDPDIHVSPATRRWLVREMAIRTRRMHDAGFVHHDLHWRNVLVRLHGDSGQPPKLWWIDCPRGRHMSWGFLRRKGIVRDLACLARTAMRRCSAIERMRFLKDYLGPTATGADRRRWSAEIQSVCERKWPGNAEPSK